MSTILKALEKQKSNSQIIMTQDKPWKVMMIVVGIIIASLIGLIVFLLFLSKSSPFMDLLTPFTQQAESQEPASYQTPIEESRVTDVTFSTKPLPIIIKDEEPLFISPEVAVKARKVQAKKREEPQVTKQQQEDFDQVSDDLRARFAQAVAAEDDFIEEEELLDVVPVNDISKMPIQFQFQVPLMRYDSHVYSSKEPDRWIRINGIDLKVGDYVGSVELINILPQRSVFNLNGQEFTLESLTDWEG